MVTLDTTTYLKATDIEHEAIGEIVDEGRLRTPEETGFDDPVFEISVKVNEITFSWTMNTTSQRNLIHKWGRDTKAWIGKKVIFSKAKQMAFGKEVEVIYARPSQNGEAHAV